MGETGGKDFIVAHPSADPAAVATAIVRGSFEYQGQKCSAASRVYAPSNLWPAIREALERDVPTIRTGDVRDFRNFMGAVIDESSYTTQAEAIDAGPLAATTPRSLSAATPTTARATSSARRWSAPRIPRST